MPNTEPIQILPVEGNPGDAYLARYMLDEGKTRFEVSHAERLKEAFERLHERAFGVVLLDPSLPDSHGLETLFRVREAAPEVPVVLSGLDDGGWRCRRRKTGRRRTSSRVRTTGIWYRARSGTP